MIQNSPYIGNNCIFRSAVRRRVPEGRGVLQGPRTSPHSIFTCGVIWRSWCTSWHCKYWPPKRKH